MATLHFKLSTDFTEPHRRLPPFFLFFDLRTKLRTLNFFRNSCLESAQEAAPDALRYFRQAKIGPSFLEYSVSLQDYCIYT